MKALLIGWALQVLHGPLVGKRGHSLVGKGNRVTGVVLLAWIYLFIGIGIGDWYSTRSPNHQLSRGNKVR